VPLMRQFMTERQGWRDYGSVLLSIRVSALQTQMRTQTIVCSSPDTSLKSAVLEFVVTMAGGPLRLFCLSGVVLPISHSAGPHPCASV
jgi:hypothetical protein